MNAPVFTRIPAARHPLAMEFVRLNPGLAARRSVMPRRRHAEPPATPA